MEEKLDQNENKESEKSIDGQARQANNHSSIEVFPYGAPSELLNEATKQSCSWSTQAAESKNEMEAQLSANQQQGYNWKLCNSTVALDYIPCLDNWQEITNLWCNKHYERRGRRCLTKLRPDLFLFLKDINAQLGRPKAGKDLVS